MSHPQILIQVRRITLILILSLALGFNSAIPSRAVESVHGKYMIDFLPIDSPYGTSPMTQEAMNTLVAQANQAFSKLTDGRITFESGVLLTRVTTTSRISVPADVKQLTPTPVRQVPAGFKDLFTVGVVAHTESLKFGGIAMNPGTQILMNGLYDTMQAAANTLLHEIGHLLRQGHASTIACNSAALCSFEEYGDYSDVMGTLALNWGRKDAEMSISAARADLFGLLSTDQILYADTSKEVKLDPVYPISAKGTKIIYLPTAGGNGYAVEFRPAVGSDANLASTRFNSLVRENWYYNNTPSYGVQVRALAVSVDGKESLLPRVSNKASGDTFLIINDVTKHQGLDAGQSLRLNDGSIIEVLSTNDVTGAQVRITRPVDTQAPTGEITSIQVGDEYFGTSDDLDIEVMRDDQGVFTWPTMKIEARNLSDNRRITDYSILIDGQLVNSTLSNSNLSTNLTTKLTSLGTHTIALQLKDAAGNTFTTPTKSLKARSYVPSCTLQKCYVGLVMDTGSWWFSASSKVMYLQKKVNGKWVNVSSAPRQTGTGGPKGSPYTFNFKYINTTAGTFSFRFYQAPYTFKGTRYTSYVGKPFTVQILPWSA